MGDILQIVFALIWVCAVIYCITLLSRFVESFERIATAFESMTRKKRDENKS